MTLKFTASYLEDSLELFRYYKKLAERAMDQVTDDQLTSVLDGEMNSIAIIVKHMAGNMHSRWTDFLTTDGEKPDRNRDSEFVNAPGSRHAVKKTWDEGWEIVFTALSPLSEADLGRTVLIRGEAYHCGQIVLLAKHFQAHEWESLTVPRGKSDEFNKKVSAREISQR